MSAQGLGVGVETEENSLVDERIFLLGPGAFLYFLAGRSDNRLDFIAIDQTSNVRVADFSRREAKGIITLRTMTRKRRHEDPYM